MLGSGTVHRGGTVALNYAQELPRSHSYRKTGGKLVFEMCRENGLGITPYYFALNFNRDIGVYFSLPRH